MLKRALTGAALIAVLVGVLLFLPKICTAVLVSLMVVVAAHELLWTTKLLEKRCLVVYAQLAAVFVVWWCYFGMPYPWALAAVLVCLAVVVAALVRPWASRVVEER